MSDSAGHVPSLTSHNSRTVMTENRVRSVLDRAGRSERKHLELGRREPVRSNRVVKQPAHMVASLHSSRHHERRENAYTDSVS
jgi:hypothetical protein